MARPGPDPALVRRARELAAQGRTQAQAAADLGVSARTLRTWGIQWPMGRTRVPEGQESARTARRRAQEARGVIAHGEYAAEVAQQGDAALEELAADLEVTVLEAL